MTMRAVDLFAGFGGFSLGASQAGAEVVLAANHWQLAVDAHRANHPETLHVCQDLNQANFHTFPDHDLLLASPACQGHSRAAQPSRKNDRSIASKHDALRSTAWAVINCVEAKRPYAVIIENTIDFRNWELYDLWLMAMERLGYAVEQHLAVASRFGVPQRRKRLIIVATRSKNPLGLVLPTAPEPGFGPCIDWEDAHVDRTEDGWRQICDKPLPVQRRIAKARARGLGERFLTQYVSNHPGVPLDEPIRTITTKIQWGVVDGDRMRMLRIREHARAMGFPDDYRWPDSSTKRQQIRGLGNAIVPAVAKWFTERVMEAA